MTQVKTLADLGDYGRLKNDSIFNLQYSQEIAMPPVSWKTNKKHLSLKLPDIYINGLIDFYLFKQKSHKTPFIGFKTITILNPTNRIKILGLVSSNIPQLDPSSSHFLVMNNKNNQLSLPTLSFGSSSFGFIPDENNSHFYQGDEKNFIEPSRISSYLTLIAKDGSYMQLYVSEDHSSLFMSHQDKEYVLRFVLKIKNEIHEYLLSQLKEQKLNASEVEILQLRLTIFSANIEHYIHSIAFQGTNKIKVNSYFEKIDYNEKTRILIQEYEDYSQDIVKRVHFIDMQDFSNPNLCLVHTTIIDYKKLLNNGDSIHENDYQYLEKKYNELIRTSEHLELKRSFQ